MAVAMMAAAMAAIEKRILMVEIDGGYWIEKQSVRLGLSVVFELGVSD